MVKYNTYCVRHRVFSADGMPPIESSGPLYSLKAGLCSTVDHFLGFQRQGEEELLEVEVLPHIPCVHKERLGADSSSPLFSFVDGLSALNSG